MSVHSRNSFMGTPSARLSQQWRENLKNRSANGSNTSLDTVQRSYHRQLTPSSVRSLGSISPSPLRVRNENVQPSRILSRSKFLSADDASLYPSSLRSSKHPSRKTSCEVAAPVPYHCRLPPAFTQDLSLSLEDINLSSPSVREYNADDDDDSDKENLEPDHNPPRLSFEVAKEEILSIDESSVAPKQIGPRPLPDAPTNPRSSHSFKRWISHLRPQTSKKKKTLTARTQRWPLDELPAEQDTTGVKKMASRRSGHRKSDSRPSTGLVDAVKSVVLDRSAGTPIPKKPRRSNLFSRSNRSSRASEDETRPSIEQPQGLINTLDPVALERATRRRKILEELVDSEASYVADLKVLIHVRTAKTKFPCRSITDDFRPTSPFSH